MNLKNDTVAPNREAVRDFLLLLLFKPTNPTTPIFNAEQSKVAYATMNVINTLSRQQNLVPRYCRHKISAHKAMHRI